MVAIISWTATILSLLGQVLISNKKKSAFPIWIISNLLWIWVNIIGIFNLANVAMYLVYTLLNIIGIIKWKKSD